MADVVPSLGPGAKKASVQPGIPKAGHPFSAEQPPVALVSRREAPKTILVRREAAICGSKVQRSAKTGAVAQSVWTFEDFDIAQHVGRHLARGRIHAVGAGGRRGLDAVEHDIELIVLEAALSSATTSLNKCLYSSLAIKSPGKYIGPIIIW